VLAEKDIQAMTGSSRRDRRTAEISIEQVGFALWSWSVMLREAAIARPIIQLPHLHARCDAGDWRDIGLPVYGAGRARRY
jgi:hypothetical protein